MADEILKRYIEEYLEYLDWHLGDPDPSPNPSLKDDDGVENKK